MKFYIPPNNPPMALKGVDIIEPIPEPPADWGGGVLVLADPDLKYKNKPIPITIIQHVIKAQIIKYVCVLGLEFDFGICYNINLYNI